jgi:hypothetical protein
MALSLGHVFARPDAKCGPPSASGYPSLAQNLSNLITPGFRTLKVPGLRFFNSTPVDGCFPSNFSQMAEVIGSSVQFCPF